VPQYLNARGRRRKNATASREHQGDDIRYSALIIKDKLARTVVRHHARAALVDGRGYRDHLLPQKCYRTST
jgi:hypothetical protein